MADSANAFTIKALVDLDLADPQGFVNEIQQVVDRVAALGKTRPMDPTTGREMGVTKAREEVGHLIRDMQAYEKAAVKAFGAGANEVKQIQKAMKDVMALTRDIRRPDPYGPKTPENRPLKPIYDARRPQAGDFTSGVKQAADAVLGEAKKTVKSGEKLSQELGEAEDPIKAMVREYQRSAALAKRIAANDEQVLTERVKMEQELAKQRLAYAKRFDTQTPKGEAGQEESLAIRQARVRTLAAANVAEERNRLTQRNMEIGLTRAAGGEKLIAQNKYQEAALSRAVKIEQHKLDLEGQSAKAIAEEKLLRDELNRAIASQVRKQTTAADRKDIAADKAAQRLADVRQEQANLKAVTPQARQAEAVLARDKRLADAKQKQADLAAMQNTIGERVVRQEAKAAADSAVQRAKERQEYLRQFDTTRTGPGSAQARARTEELARTAVMERQQALAQRTAEIGIARESGGAKTEGAARALEALYAREISIERLKVEQADGSAKAMAEEKVRRDALNREVAKEVRLQQDVSAIAAENVAKQRDRLAQRAATRAAETPEDLTAVATDKAAEAARRREIDIEQLKAEQAAGASKSIAEEKVRRDQLNREIAKEVRLQQDINAIAGETVAKQRDRLAQRAAVRGAETPEDRSAIAADKVADAARKRAIDAEVRALTDTAAVAQDNAAISRDRIRQQRANLAARTPEDVQDQAKFAVESRLAATQAKLAERAEMRGAVGQQLMVQEQLLAREVSEEKATRAKLKAADTKLIASEAEAARAAEEYAARLKIAKHGGDSTGLQGAELKAKAANLEVAAANREKAAKVRLMTEAERQANVERIASEKFESAKTNRAVRLREREMIKEAVSTGQVGKGDWFQNLQFRMHGNQAKLPEDYSQLREMMGQRLMTTASFTASGLLLGGGIAAISEMFRDATRLEQTFIRLRGQMEGLGRVGSFPHLREEIKSIAAETGIASDEAASLTSRFIGITKDPLRAAAEARSAAKLSVVTGMDPKDVEKTMVPVAKAFGLSVEQIGDALVDLGEKTGAPEEDLANFLSRSAVAAKNAGMTFEELKIIGGTMANALGPGFAGSAEAMNKTFQTVTTNAQAIIELLAQTPDTMPFMETFAKQIGEGKPGEGYLTLIRAYTKFSDQQKQDLVKKVVPRREAEDFYAVFDNAVAVVEQLDHQQESAAESAGKMEERWSEMEKTVAVTFQSLAKAFETFGETLFRSGLADALTTIGAALKGFVDVGGVALGMFARFNEAGGGVPAMFAKIAIAAALMNKAYTALSPVFRKATGGLSSVNQAESRSEDATSSAKDRGLAASLRAAEGEQLLATSKREVIGANVAEEGALAAPMAGAPLPRRPRPGEAAAAGAGAYAPPAAPLPVRPKPREIPLDPKTGKPLYRMAQPGDVIPYGGPAPETRPELPIRPRPPTPPRPGLSGGAALGSGLPARPRPPTPPRPPTTPLSAEQQAASRRALSGFQSSVRRAGRGITSAGEAIAGGITSATGLSGSQTDAARQTSDYTDATSAATNATRAVTRRMGALGRALTPKAVGERVDPRYLARREAIEGRLPTLAEGQLAARPGWIMRSISGGSIFKSAKADVAMERAGLTPGPQSKMAIGMLAIAGAGAVLSEVENQRQSITEALEGAKLRLRRGNLGQLRAEREAQGAPSLGERFTSLITRTPTVESVISAEERYAEATDRGAYRVMGLAGRVQTPADSSKETQRILESRSDKLGKDFAAKFNDQSREALSDAFLGQGKDILNIGKDLGVVDQTIWRPVAKKLSDDEIIRIRAWIDANKDSEDEAKKEFANRLAIRLRDITSAQGGFEGIEAEGAKVGEQKALAKAIEEAGGAEAYAMKQSAAGTKDQYETIETLRQKFQNRQMSQGEYLSQMQALLTAVRSSAEKMAGTPEGQKFLNLIGSIELEMSNLQDASIKWLDDITMSMAAIGTTRPKRSKAVMHAASVAKQSLDAQVDAVPQLMQEEVEAWQEDTEKLFSPEARIAALNAGPQISAQTKKGFLAKQAKDDPKASAAFEKLSKIVGKPAAEIRDEIAKRAVESNITFAQAAQQYIQDEIDNTKGTGNYQKLFDLIYNRTDITSSLSGIQNMPDQQLTAAQKRAREIDIRAGARKAQARLAQSKTAGDPMAQARIAAREAQANLGDVQAKARIGEATQEDVVNAQADVNDALFQEAEQALNITRAQMALAAQRDAEDPLKTAANQLKAAEFELAHAHGDADRAAKQQAVLSAQQNLANSISAGLSADAQLAITLANLRGDSVAAANEAVKDAQRLLDEALAKNITDKTVIDPLKGRLAEALKQQYLAPIQEQISDLDYFYGMEQISLGDYIAGLEAQLSALTYNSDEYKELALKIHNLKKGAQADLGWQLPGNLELPTLYEARRASQTVFNPNMAGGAYQDNRNIQVNIAVNGAQDPVTVATQVSAALTESLRGGPTYTAGIPVSTGM